MPGGGSTGTQTRSQTKAKAHNSTVTERSSEEQASLSEEGVPAPTHASDQDVTSEQRVSNQPGPSEDTRDGADRNAIVHGAASQNAIPLADATNVGDLYTPVPAQASVNMTLLDILLSFWANLISWSTIGPRLKFDMDNRGPRFSCETIVGIPILLALFFWLYTSFSYISVRFLSLLKTLLDSVTRLRSVTRTPWSELPDVSSYFNQTTTTLNTAYEALDWTVLDGLFHAGLGVIIYILLSLCSVHASQQVMNLPTFSSSDLLGEGATSPSVIPAIGIFAAAISSDVKPIFVIDGTEFPRLFFEHHQTSANVLQFYIQWDGMPSEYSSLEPYAFVDVKGRRHSVGETSVVQQYLADNNIDAYKTTNTTDALPLPFLPDPSDFIPNDHAPVPSNSAIVDFQPNDVAYSKESNDYVIVLQRLNAGTSNELYSIRRRDGFTLKVSKSTLLHPAEAARLNLEPSPEPPWDAEHAEPTIIEEPTAPKKKSTPVVKPPPAPKAAVPKPAKTVTFTPTTPITVTDQNAVHRERRARTDNVTLRDIGSSAISSGLTSNPTKGILKRSLGIHKGSPSSPSFSLSMFLLMCLLEMGGCHKDLSFSQNIITNHRLPY